MQPDDVTILDILDAAIDRLQTTGWIQGRMGLSSGPNCLMGALRFGAFHDLLGPEWATMRPRPGSAEMPAYMKAFRAVKDEVRKRATGLELGWGLGDWNDHPERTYEDVLLVLKTARYELEAADAT